MVKNLTCCNCKVVNNELIFFRKFSDPDTRKADEPRLHYYKIKILQVWIILGTY